MVPKTCHEPRGHLGDRWVILLRSQVPRNSHELSSGSIINLSYLS